MKTIMNKTFGSERALYDTHDTIIENCRIEGEEDGESFLKESGNIAVVGCFFDLRYPMWHVDGLKMSDCEMTEHCRAALWYDSDVKIENCVMNGIKALRECENVTIASTSVRSPEFGWRCKGIDIRGGSIEAEYAFFESRNIRIDGLKFSGKYSFQYTNDMTIENSELKTKDAFWHSHGVTVRDSVLIGEYLAWYSDGLTLINCHIKGTQPFCYCKNLRLINCTMEDCDLAFEYSDVQADIKGEVLSVKNPRSGKIVADGYGEIILRDGKYDNDAQIVVRDKIQKAE